MIRRFVAALVLTLLPALAFAQGGTVLQSGRVTPGHVAGWVTNGVITDGGYALGGLAGTNITEIGIANTGTPFCITDAPIDFPYHQLCLGANTLLGYGVISYNAYGGASQLPLVCIVNGITLDPCLTGGTVTSITVTGSPCLTATPNPIVLTGTIAMPVPQTVPCGGTGATTFVSSNPLVGNGVGALTQGTRTGTTTIFATAATVPTIGECAIWDANLNLGSQTCVASGTVTSVGFNAPSEFIVTGEPIIGSGIIMMTKATEPVRSVWAGPVSGSPAVPTFRELQITDLPSLTCAVMPADGCPFDIAMFWPGTAPADQIVRVALPRAVSCSAGLLGSRGNARVAATATSTVNINQVTGGGTIATNRGSMTWTAGGNVATAAAIAQINFLAGDDAEFAFPGTPDATLADVAITLKCSRI